MSRFLAFLRAIPGALWAVLAAAGSIVLLLLNARRRGEAVGTAKAEARVETAGTQEAVQRAESAVVRAIRAEARWMDQRAAEGHPVAPGEPPPPEVAAEVARAQDDAAVLRDRILRRTKVRK